MRPSYAFMIIVTALFAIAETAVATTESTQFSQVSTGDHIQPGAVAADALPTKRLLRTDELNKEDEEERGLEKLKDLLQVLRGTKIESEFSINQERLPPWYVKHLVKNGNARDDAFKRMVTTNTDAEEFGQMMIPGTKNRDELLQLYREYLSKG